MIREMKPEDVPQVIDIEKASFSDPWSFGSFMEDINLDFVYDPVYEENGRILGYGSCWMMPDEAHIANIAVREDMRHMGIGRKIVENMLKEAEKRGEERALLEVRVSNESAINLYESFGFVKIYRSKRFYEDNNEDAFIMELKFA